MYFSQNIRYLRNKKKLSQESLAIELDITRNQVASYEDERAHPPLQTLVKYSEFFKLPIDALVKTDLSKSNEEKFIDIGNHRILFPIQITEDGNDIIEIVTKEASAGYLDGYSDTEYVSKLPTLSLPFLPTGKHRAFIIKGDSMEPWVQPGDYVIGEYVENIKDVRDNDCYIILTKEEGLVYKRVGTEKIKDNVLVLSSDNKSYSPFEVHLSEVLEVWKFKLRLSLGQYKADELNPQYMVNLMRSFNIELKDMRAKFEQLSKKEVA